MTGFSTATVKAAFVNPPREGKKNWSVKTPEGVFYSVPADLASKIDAGGVYEIRYEDQVFNNTTYHMVKDVTRKEAAPAKPAYKGGKYGPVDDQTPMRIYVCGALNAALSAGRIPVPPSGGNFSEEENVLVDYTKMLTRVYHKTIGAPVSKLAQEMDDDIDF